MIEWREHLTSDAKVCGEQFCAKGTSMLVTLILDNVVRDEILRNTRALQPIQIDAGLAPAQQLVATEQVHPRVRPRPRDHGRPRPVRHRGPLLGVSMALALLSPGVGRAATFNVNSTTDLVDDNIGDGRCRSASSFIDVCTLRGAIQEANATPAIPDTINVPAGVYDLMRRGSGEDASWYGDLDLTSDITIVGNGVGGVAGCEAGTTNTCIRVNGSGDRVLEIIPSQDRNITVNLRSVRIEGGVLGPGGGIYSHTLNGRTPTVNLTNVWVRGNDVGLSWGGGIFNDGGNLFIHSTSDTAFSDTVSFIAYNAAGHGGGILVSSGTVNITGPTQIAFNTARDWGGAGMMVWGGQTVLGSGSLVYGNTAAQGYGGGLYVIGPAVVALVNAGIGTRFGNMASYGGGVLVHGGTLNVTSSSSVSGNQATNEGGGIYVSSGTVQVTGAHVANNIAANHAGGGIFNGGGTVTVTNSTVSGNSAASDGGGIFNDTNGNVTVTKSTIRGNSAASDGGGLFNDTSGNVTVTNSTVSGNSAASDGGGIFNDGYVTATNLTVSGNAAGVLGGGIHNIGGVALVNSVIASQLSGADCFGPFYLGGIDSRGHNLDSDATCWLTAEGDISGGNADLLPLMVNAPGDTATHALGSSSLARDVIPLGTNGCGTTITTDQRGVTRPRGTHCDMGAFEAGPVVVANAGPDQVAIEAATVTLDASASSGDGLTFLWEQLPGGPLVTLSDPTSQAPSFTAPLLEGGVGESLTLTFRLTVSDGALLGTDDVAVTVEQVNHAPTANAGLDQTHDEGSLVTLDGRASSDPDGDQLVTFSWRQIAGPPVALALADAKTATPSFTAPAVGSGGETLTFRLTVSDGALPSKPDGGRSDVTITIRNLNDPPSCAAAHASPSLLWPANHRLIPVAILGVSDPNGDPVTITVTGVTQDEPIDGFRDGNTSPDAVISNGTVLIRAERQRAGNGRVYQVSFTAADGQLGSCSGAVTVSVPRRRKGGESPVDDGQLYNSVVSPEAEVPIAGRHRPARAIAR